MSYKQMDMQIFDCHHPVVNRCVYILRLMAIFFATIDPIIAAIDSQFDTDKCNYSCFIFLISGFIWSFVSVNEQANCFGRDCGKQFSR